MAAQRTKPTLGRPPQPVDDATAGGRLRALRGAAQLDQQEAADRLGVSRTILSRYETGIHAIPDPVIERASQVFAVTPSFIRYGNTETRMAQVVGRIGAVVRSYELGSSAVQLATVLVEIEHSPGARVYIEAARHHIADLRNALTLIEAAIDHVEAPPPPKRQRRRAA